MSAADTDDRLSDCKVLAVYRQLRWDGERMAPVDAGTGRPVLSRRFLSRMKCQLFLGRYHVRLID